MRLVSARRAQSFVLCALAAWLLLSGAAQSAPLTIVNRGDPVEIYSVSRALIIGLSEYRNDSWPRLPAISNEARVVRGLLTRQGFDVTLAENLDSSSLKETVRGFLTARHTRATRLVVFVAGHGWTDRFRLTGHIVPTDAGPAEVPGFRKALLDMEAIKDWARESDAQQILFLFDSCFSGAVFLHRSGYTPPRKLFLSDALRRSRQFITAGDERQIVPAISKFVPTLDQALTQGLADFNKDGLITANELGMWVKDRVIATGSTTPQYGELPEARSIPGSMIFVAGGAPARPVVEVAAAPPKDSSDAMRRAAAVGEAPAGKEIYSGLDILYYRKAIDGRLVIDALARARVPFIETRALLPDHFPVNAIACGPNTPIAAIKSLALTLLDNDVPIRAILQYGDPARLKGDLEIISLTKGGRGTETLDSPPLTRTDIENLSKCPRWLQRSQSQ
jgi:hypothetical protein